MQVPFWPAPRSCRILCPARHGFSILTIDRWQKIQTGLPVLRPGFIEALCYVKNACLLVVILCISFPAFGAALGQPKRTSMIGYAVGVTHVSVDDPQGDTESVWALQPATLIYTARLMSGVRYWSELYYHAAVLDAVKDRIGQDVERFGFQVSLQKNLPVTPGWVTWFGAGIGVSQTNYTTRHTIDSEGYLLARYPDRSDTGAVLLLNVVSEWTLSRNWSLGIKLEQAVAMAGDAEGSQGSLALLYRY